MRKRIFSLALAGTMAFSVFGSAMSAEAGVVYNGGSSHQGAYDGAYYTSYTPAGDIRWNINSVEESTTTVIDVDLYSPVAGLSGTVSSGTKLFTLPGAKSGTSVADVDSIVEMKTGDGIYFADLDSFMTANGYSNTDATDGVITYSTNNYVLAYQGSGAATTYYLFSEEYWNANTNLIQSAYTKADAETLYYTSSTFTSFSEGIRVVTNKDDGSVYNNDLSAVISSYAANSAHPYYYIADGVDDSVTNATNLTKYDKDSANLEVVTTESSLQQGFYTDAGYTTLDAVDIDDLDAILEETVYPSGVVYLYDYYYDSSFPSNVSDSEFADAWADGNVAQLLYNKTSSTSGTISAEASYSTRSIRGDVLYLWEDFLDELGLSYYASESTRTTWAKTFLSNYAYTYYDSSVVTNVTYNESTGSWTITYGGSVNLYNFNDLIEDILYYTDYSNVSSAQTSELIYLMQQYDKYVSEGFVDEISSDTNDWGDLLVSLLEAPTEDDFRTSTAYKRYTSAAEDLIEDYEDATTYVELTMAEAAMYDFVTSYSSSYTTAATPDKDALYDAIDSTYFNATWTSFKNVYAGMDLDGVLSTSYRSNTGYSYAWAMYPLYDYTGGSYYGSEPGVDTGISSSYAVTYEYYWFYNVYALAYDVYSSNKYQGTVDLMASVLEDAIDALVTSKSTYNSTILAAQEQADKLASLIETDYTESIWYNREKIYSFISDEVGNNAGPYATANAAIIASETSTLMGYQKNQTVVTKSDITSVKSALESAESALEALQNDSDKYNAAQATALQNAIDNCQKIIDLYNGVYATSSTYQSVNGTYSAAVGDKDQILKSDIDNAITGVDDAINFSSIVMGWSQNESGQWLYGTEDGYLANGWNKIGATWFYFNEDGTAKQSEWFQEDGIWYYFNSNCGAACGWAKIDGDWYYFKGNNAMKTGWEKVDGNWYYMASSGKMVTGWCEIDGKWYYFSKESNALGQMLYSTTVDGYTLDENGAWTGE